MAAFGSLVERVIVRPILGYPQFSIVMVTIGLGFALRAIVGMIWGTDDLRIDTPFSSGVMHVGKLVIADDKLSVIVATVLLCGVLWLYFNKTRMGVAMQATSQNMLGAYYMGIPVKRVFSLIWAISAVAGFVQARRDLPFPFFGSVLNYRIGVPISGGPIAPANGSPESLSFFQVTVRTVFLKMAMRCLTVARAICVTIHRRFDGSCLFTFL